MRASKESRYTQTGPHAHGAGGLIGYTRRDLIRVGVAGLIGSLGGLHRVVAADTGPGRTLGTPLDDDGKPAAAVKLHRVCGAGPGNPIVDCDIWAPNARTPLQSLSGIITPASLHFERSHSETAQIDAGQHRLMVHGEVAHPRVFTMEDIIRMPSVSRICFIECAGNGWDNWARGKPEWTVQQTHGMIGTTDWTGVPLSVVLDQVGPRKGARWMLAEGADGAAVDRSVPLTEFVLANALLAYAQNGQPLRPGNGYPLRLVLPGFEGNMNIKWLRRLKLGTEPFMTRWETDTYTRLRPDGKAQQFYLIQDVNSVITDPSGGMRIAVGYHEIRGLAWSGRGRVAKVEVSADGGRSWKTAQLVDPILPQAQTRFRCDWHWDGKPSFLQSRATDELGRTQPTRDALIASVGPNAIYHYNAIQSWQLDEHGRLTNAGYL